MKALISTQQGEIETLKEQFDTKESNYMLQMEKYSELLKSKDAALEEMSHRTQLLERQAKMLEDQRVQMTQSDETFITATKAELENEIDRL